MNSLKLETEYKTWFATLKQTIAQTQIKAASRVNYELLDLYWNMGKMIIEKQEETRWGDKLLETLSADLSAEFPDIKGFSKINLFYIKNWYLFYNQPDIIIPQVVEQLRFSENSIIPQLVEQLRFPEKISNNDLISILVKQICFAKYKFADRCFRISIN